MIYLCQDWKGTESNGSSYMEDDIIKLLPFKWLKTVGISGLSQRRLYKEKDRWYCLHYVPNASWFFFFQYNVKCNEFYLTKQTISNEYRINK